MIDKVNRIADDLAREVEDAMQKDLFETIDSLEKFVKDIGKPYQDAAQNKLDKLLETQDELSDAQKKLQILQVEIQNLHVSSWHVRTTFGFGNEFKSLFTIFSCRILGDLKCNI